MGKKLVLPLLDVLGDRRAHDPKKKPTLEVARARLGGKADGGAAVPGKTAGTVVAYAGKPAAVVFGSDTELHVLLETSDRGARMKRVRLDDVSVFGGDVPAGLASIAADASVFALLAEGQSVRYADDGGALREAKLVEKCRYGALVARDDGTIVAVGFRKLWPASTRGAS